jgi:hypothetical protein
LLVRWIARGIYRVCFHPLRGFPGPKTSAFTRIPHLFTIIRGVPLSYVKNFHLLYGEVVRISPDELSFDDPQALRDIHGRGLGGKCQI